MLIAVDGNEANVKKRVGVSVYAYEMIKYFKSQANQSLAFVIFLRHQPLKNMPKPTSHFQYQVVKGRFFWSQLFLPFHLFINLFQGKKYDVFFSPAHYIPRFCPAPTVVTIHDLAYLYYPNDFLKKDLYKLTFWTKFALEKSTKIIAVSKTTKKDILVSYPIKSSKIKVIYNGYEKKITSNNRSSLLTKWPLSPKNYFLYVGTIQPRKNINILIKAFAKLKDQKKSFRLVIVGKKGWLYKKLFILLKKLNLNKEIVFTGYINDQELINLYKNALALILPSFYEGFGIPLLEAFNYRCPVISSFSSSLPEIGGNACLYFNPKKVGDLLDKINEIASNEKLRKELIKKGERRLKNFSWQKSAQETLAYLEEVADNKKNG